MECRARQYIKAQGLDFITANYHSKFGEIDLIFKDQDCWVFVEVKYRSQTNYGEAAEQVVKSKQQKIIRTAQVFLQKQGLNEYNTQCRFDVLSLTGLAINPRISWLKHAFFGA
ncbi:YraN family protein [Thalassotalea litorea]|uniref:UPF0102 protein FE810_04125 n=2 Tax=Thalassotalea litorea TaxID=2020715 RepID=A0A5R9IN23_9GAMM|nr:YraN family protein [Thalassotalea litorea]